MMSAMSDMSEKEAVGKLEAAITLLEMGVAQGATRWARAVANGPTLFDVFHDAIRYVDEAANPETKALGAKLRTRYARL